MYLLAQATSAATSTPNGIWEIAQQVPALVVLVVLVSWFLKYLREERQFQKQLTDEQSKCIESQEKMLINMSQALGKAIAIMEQMEKRL